MDTTIKNNVNPFVFLRKINGKNNMMDNGELCERYGVDDGDELLKLFANTERLYQPYEKSTRDNYPIFKKLEQEKKLPVFECEDEESPNNFYADFYWLVEKNNVQFLCNTDFDGLFKIYKWAYDTKNDKIISTKSLCPTINEGLKIPKDFKMDCSELIINGPIELLKEIQEDIQNTRYLIRERTILYEKNCLILKIHQCDASDIKEEIESKYQIKNILYRREHFDYICTNDTEYKFFKDEWRVFYENSNTGKKIKQYYPTLDTIIKDFKEKGILGKDANNSMNKTELVLALEDTLGYNMENGFVSISKIERD